ncbi:acyl carrier protein [Buttiauxella noackiae]|uniref:acyl carrier protein n=1 Tax=Buttiauxella noackiae TaxID=82992 RepID=UPI0028D8AE1A|nr:acyl carrier protein [Buttiauxella noackiae]
MKKYPEAYTLVCEMLCDAKDLEFDALEPDMLLRHIKLDSLDYVELMVLAKREFGFVLTPELFIDNPDMTLSELCHLLVGEKK